MTPEQSDQLLLLCGLSMEWKPSHNNKSDGDNKQENKIQAKPNCHAWEIFAVEQNLKEGYFYFDRHNVKEHTGDQKVYWLGVGLSSGKGSCLAVNPSQFQMSKTPPRLSGEEVRRVRSFSKKVLLILGIYSEAIVEDAEDEEDGEEFDSATTSLQPDESDSGLVNQVDENVRMLASNLLEKIADSKLDVVAGTEQLFLMMRTAKYDEQIRRLESVTIISIEPVKENKSVGPEQVLLPNLDRYWHSALKNIYIRPTT
jgi:hypothetical protein